MDHHSLDVRHRLLVSCGKESVKSNSVPPLKLATFTTDFLRRTRGTRVWDACCRSRVMCTPRSWCRWWREPRSSVTRSGPVRQLNCEVGVPPPHRSFGGHAHRAAPPPTQSPVNWSHSTLLTLRPQGLEVLGTIPHVGIIQIFLTIPSTGRFRDSHGLKFSL